MFSPRPEFPTGSQDYHRRYLKGTRNRGLLYRASGLTLEDEWTLTLWVDSDYATCPDTRRSRAGFLIYLNEMPEDAGGWTTVSRLCFRLWPDVASHTGGVHGVVAMVGVVGEGVRLLLLRSRSSANMAAAAAGWLTKEAGPAQSVKEEAICLCLRQRSRVFACLAELHSD